MGYGVKELIYAEPFADALVADPAFRSWVLRKTKFAEFASEARLLHGEMRAQRSDSAKYWWRSHFSESCRCPGCSGQETDLLAIFETSTSLRFALHIEVKHPGDRFKEGGTQAAAYPIRALCWSTAGKTPSKVLPHSEAATALLCSAAKLGEFSPYLKEFGTVITFEDVESNFPNATVRSV